MKTFIFERSELDRLVETLKRRGYKVIGPILRDSAIIYDELTDTNELPVGWTDEQTNAAYRLKNRNDRVSDPRTGGTELFSEQWQN